MEIAFLNPPVTATNVKGNPWSTRTIEFGSKLRPKTEELDSTLVGTVSTIVGTESVRIDHLFRRVNDIFDPKKSIFHVACLSCDHAYLLTAFLSSFVSRYLANLLSFVVVIYSENKYKIIIV